MTTPDVIALQLAATNAPLPPRTTTGTNLLLPDVSLDEHLAHFPEEVYSLRDDSHLKRLMSVLLGQSGVGQARQRLIVSRLQQVIQGVHFYDLDRFYGPLFGVRRNVAEMLTFDPYTETATTEQWNEAHAKDASFRSRIVQFARAISFGATPTGVELIAEALLSVDCDVYESFIQADSSYQTNAEITAAYPTYASMEGVSYGTLEGAGLARMAGDNRREFIIRPKRPITASEAYELTRVLSRIKPADARFTIDINGVASYLDTEIRQGVADSNFWEVTTTIVPTKETVTDYITVNPPDDPEPFVMPKPPFVQGQSLQWSYATDVIGTSAFYVEHVTWQDLLWDYITSWNWPYWDERWGYSRFAPGWGIYQYGSPYLRKVIYGALTNTPTQRLVLPLGGRVDFVVANSLVSAYEREIQNYSLDLYSNPYRGSTPYASPDLSPLYVGGYLVESLQAHFDGAGDNTPSYAPDTLGDYRYWRSPFRPHTDNGYEVLEYRLADVKPINKIEFDVSYFPHRVEVLVGDEAGNWTQVAHSETTESRPRTFKGVNPQDIHSEWKTESFQFDTPVLTSRLRIQMTRIEGDWPLVWNTYYAPWGWRATDYSLALRNLDVGYAVRSIADVPQPKVPHEPTVIAVTRDIIGSRVEYSLRQERAYDMIEALSAQWRCEPQPVSYAVVNLYLDVTDDTGGPTVIDRFFLDPTHPGPHLTLYYTNDVIVANSDDTDAYNDAVWTPIQREYTVQKGFIQVPPTSARHFKFEFTALTAEPYDPVLPITRKVRLFPQSAVDRVTQGVGAMDAPPSGVTASKDVPAPTYADAELALRNATTPDRTYSPTEAVVATDPASAVALRGDSWAFGFQPWHQGGPAPRFDAIGTHTYDTLEINHVNKIGYFVGLRSIRAYRMDFTADDDTQVYLEPFHDFLHITPGFTWTFNPNALTTGLSSTCVATSKVMSSLHNVRALQFATQQTPPIQLVPDDDFRDPALASSTWTDTDGWHKVGDAVLAYLPTTHSVVLQRFLQPVTPPASHAPGHLAEHVVHPVFSSRDVTAVGPAPAPPVGYGGVETPILGVAAGGQVHAAVRGTIRSQTQPFYLEITSGGSVVASKKIDGAIDTVVETYVSYRLNGGEGTVQARVVQYVPSTDAIEIDTLSVFDEGIVWDFSVNGGTDWITAYNIRNNANGVLTFPAAGNQLVWRARGLRPNMGISALKIRPLYVGQQDARYNGAQRGPNVSVYDQDVPIQDDPMFTDWRLPIPKGWFNAFKRFQSLPIEGAPNVTEFARFYGRPATDTVATPTDTAAPHVIAGRTGDERMDFFQPLSENATRSVVYKRTATDSVAAPTDQGSGLKVLASPGKPFNRVVHVV